jgi:hypothetical protein
MDVRRHLSTIATTLGFCNSVLLHEQFFVAVEGVSETSAFPIMFRKHPLRAAGAVRRLSARGPVIDGVPAVSVAEGEAAAAHRAYSVSSPHRNASPMATASA